MDLFAQQLPDFVWVARNVFEIFRQEIHRPRVQRIEGHPGAFMGQGREHQYRGRAALHDMPHGRDAVHHRHLVVHGDHVRLECQGLIDRLFAVGRGTDDLNTRVRRKNFRDAAAENPESSTTRTLTTINTPLDEARPWATPSRIKYAGRRNA